jgi:predicted P-loop ATPase/GTPase
MKIHDFGLWFRTLHSREYSTTIPPNQYFYIMYDGIFLGYQASNLYLRIFDDQPYIVNLKNNFKKIDLYYRPYRRLTLDDFEVVRNPSRPLNQ